MAILISAHKLAKSFSSRTLFEGVSFAVESGQRIGLIGPNGAGKSTLLKIVAEKVNPDEGSLSVQRGLRVGFLEQVSTFQSDATIHSTIMEGSVDPDDWQEMSRAQMLMSQLSLSDPEQKVADLSGGWKKRLALARELMREPDLLLLDEPTNHLDVESIIWLEKYLAGARFATIVITHDRLFLQRVSNQIFELDRRHKDGLLRVNGSYADYLLVREQLLNAQEQRETKLRNTLRREAEWMSRGPQARLTKQQARQDAFEDLSTEVDELNSRNQNLRVRMDFQGLEKNPKKLIEAKGIQKSYNGQVVVPQMDLLITPKTRLGLLGANGCGKSTLIRMLVGDIAPDKGEVYRADALSVSYFEQNRETLDPSLSVFKTICPIGEYVDCGDTKIHAKSYLARFLFTYEQMEMPVGKLSGGEQSRILIARLMLKRANVLILDEPTNDLDMATLDVLQDVLLEFNGAIILVTHDRYFLDQVSNQILAFETVGGKKVCERFAELAQWDAWRASLSAGSRASQGAPEAPTATATPKARTKLSYKDQRELDGMEANIQKREAQLAQLTQESLRPEIVADAKGLLEVTSAMASTQVEIDRLYARWAELESLRADQD